MKKLSPYLLGLSLAIACSGMAAAQDTSSETAPKTRILQITREFTKPGKGGEIHDKSESAFVQAMARAKSPTYYIAMTSLSGKSRALYLTWYDSFAAWEKDTEAVEKNSSLSAALEHAAVADGELLDSLDQAVLQYSADMSLHSRLDLSQFRYLEISSYKVRPGHDKEWDELVKMVKDGYEKAAVGAHWGGYRMLFGGEGGTYFIFIGHQTLAEVDKGFEDDKQFGAAMGEDGMKKLDSLVAASIESSEHQLFAINPRQSYVDPAWIKENPDFWKPKAATAPAAKAATPDKKANP